MDFTDKVVLITGASSGIGASTARYLANLNAQVVLTGRNAENLNIVREECEGLGNQTPFVLLADVTRTEDNNRLINAIINKFGKLDVLVNSAGCGALGDIKHTSLGQYDLVMNTNMRGVYHLTMLAVPHLIKSAGNIVSVSSVTAFRPCMNGLAYNISKAALDQFTRCLALDLASKHVRVNSVNPAFIATRFHRRRGLDHPTDFMMESQRTIPLGRHGQGLDIAAAIAFLASERNASFITGKCLAVDGGMSVLNY